MILRIAIFVFQDPVHIVPIPAERQVRETESENETRNRNRRCRPERAREECLQRELRDRPVEQRKMRHDPAQPVQVDERGNVVAGGEAPRRRQDGVREPQAVQVDGRVGLHGNRRADAGVIPARP